MRLQTGAIGWLLSGHRDEPVPPPVGLVKDPDPARVGIACSGGGIRSASFNLGALQALEEKQVVRNAEYLAAVSGGAYIAAAYSMVAKTGGDDDSDADAFAETGPFAPGSPEEQYVRNHASYMAPTGLALVYLLLRMLLGLIWNLFFIGLPLAALGVLLGAFVYEHGPSSYGKLVGQDDACVDDGAGCGAFADVPGWVWTPLAVIAAAVVAVGVCGLLRRFRTDFWRKVVETWSVRLLLLLAAAALVLVAIPVLIDALWGDVKGEKDVTNPTTAAPAPVIGGVGVVTLLGGVLLQLRAVDPEPARPSLAERAGKLGEAASKAWGALGKLPATARMALVYLIGALVGPAVLVGIIASSAAVTLGEKVAGGTSLKIAAALIAAFGVIYHFADLNSWSLHSLYRRRLCWAFALKRVRKDGQLIARERDYDRAVKLSKSKVPNWPKLVVCAAANVSDPGATPPGRGVTSFTFTHDWVGGPLVHKKETGDYEHALGANRRRDVTLPGAVAISGAAVSPSMGKLTQAPLRFLMALANVRLGVWLPNPRRMVDDGWGQKSLPGRLHRVHRWWRHEDEWNDVLKKPRPYYLFKELLGRNRYDAKFLYVTDGGHYENLGLVELLRRGCMTVYCFDASGGASAKELGDAIAIARSELGVEIDITAEDLSESGTPPFAKQCLQVGRIRFRERPDDVGALVYVRSVMTEGLTWDVVAFRDTDPVFPHHSTMDQLYTDQKFEAYRALGYAAGVKALAVRRP